ncbi:MAG: dynamin family protein [bacterium]|nr:dynamin family protein [bacterium]
MVTMALDGPLAVMRETEIDLLSDVAHTLGEMGDHTQEDRKRLMDVAQDLRDLFFLVVIIGEFNAGKSSFVNALLRDTLLPTGITPTTEMIELVRYAEQPNRKPIMRDESLREWAHPNTGAPGVAIVDTPGTGSVFQRHEKVAKEFLHRSDLVIFLLSAKRAFAETERIYLEMAKNYGKKIILIVNQVDLLDANEQVTVRRFIEQQVRELLNLQPLIFMVSAKEALAAQASGNPAPNAGGMDAVRAHLRGLFEETPPTKQKLLAQLEMAASVVRRYYDLIKSKADAVTLDTTRVKEVQQELQKQSLGLDAQLIEARGEIDKVFTGMRQRGMQFIDANLSIRKIGSSINKDKLQAEFQDVVIGRALRDINEATNGYINAVIDSSRVYWRGVIDRLNQLREILEQELSGLDAGIYAEQRENLQDAIRIAEAELKSYSTGRVVEDIHQEFEDNRASFNVSAIAASLGIITAIVAAGPGAAPFLGVVFFPAALVALGGGAFALRYYQRVQSETKKDFSARVDRLMHSYHEALDELTRKERARLSQYGTQVLTPIFSRLEVLAQRYTVQQSQFEGYQRRVETLRKGIEES